MPVDEHLKDIHAAVHQLAAHLAATQNRLITAESCTGGLLASVLTDVPGASQWYEGGYVTYQLTAKQQMLEISADTLAEHGAVSQVVAQKMAQQALAHSHAQLSIATTGLAGPEGDGTATRVGTLWIGWAQQTPQGKWADTECFHLELPRLEFRKRAVVLALQGLLNRVGSSHTVS